MARYVYAFGNGKAKGHAGQKGLLGGKGANLAEMTRIGIPVPPGFTLSTRACNDTLARGGRLSREIKDQVSRALAQLERRRGCEFGDSTNPLLVSVRSGAKFSMPGMMDTILNLGLNAEAVEGLAERSGDRRFAFDSYRRFLQMYSDVVLDIEKGKFEQLLERAKKRRKVKLDTELTAEDLEQLCAGYHALIEKESGKPFPQKPKQQLWGAITAVFRSWNNPRARRYRREYGIADDLGTAVNIQSMVFGNLGDDCATGVAFTRDPATGDNDFYGEFLINAQGEDVVAGIRTPQPITAKQAGDTPERSMERLMPDAFAELMEIRSTLETHYRDMQDVEFTIERGHLYMLQTRTGKRTGRAALSIAFDMHAAKVISRDEVVERVEPDMVGQLLAPVFEQSDLDEAREAGRMIATGLPAGPGAASGAIALSAERAEAMAHDGKSVLLVRAETSPEDLGGMVAAVGILTSRGGMTSHAAVVARGMGKPCVVGAEQLHVDEEAGEIRAGGVSLREGDVLSIDGSSGQVFQGPLQTRPSEIQQVLVEKTLDPADSKLYRRYEKLMRWADRLRRLEVRTNADTPHDSDIARAFGARGIGLCRTEHMFFGEDRIAAVREMILADDERQRGRALKKLLPMQRRDFEGIFRAMDGYPVTIRLLDPPLHEFLPTTRSQFAGLASELGVSEEDVRVHAERLAEANPMLGHRGCRLGITFPEIYDMQTRAILQAAARCQKKGVKVRPEIMIPLVGIVTEYQRLEERVREIAREEQKAAGVRLKFLVGTMIEIPRAALTAGQIAAEAEFFSFGTNDLTQMTYGYSRDDVGKFLPAYLSEHILPADPFQTVDPVGVGRLVKLAIKEGRQVRAKLKIGVCGEHGGDPRSVAFFHRAGADYVSCSPFRVPVARLAAAHAVLAERGRGASGTA